MAERLAPRIALAAALAACGSRADGEAPLSTAVTIPGPSGAASSPPGSATARAASSAPSAAPPPPDPASVVATLGPKCADGLEGHVAFSPEAPSPDRPLRVLVTSSKGALDGLVVIAPGAPPSTLASEPRLGPPTSLYASVDAPREGTYRVVVHRSGRAVACAEAEVRPRARPDRRARGPGAWPIRRSWNAETEDLYSAWIEKLFDVKEDEPLSVGALHELTRDSKRNFLFDHLGLGEDEPSPQGLKLDPDCADLPYTLRAYFAFKIGLPFAFSSCTRGSAARPPHCTKRSSSLVPLDDAPNDRVKRMDRFLRTRLADMVHSGTGRTLGTDDATDYYPIELSRETLRPGTIYADPYGHILVVARRVPQTADRAGALFAVDGQPDGTVAKKRFWAGNFLFSLAHPSMGGPGFKRFRPAVLRDGEIVTLTNAEIEASADYGDFDLGQTEGDARDFYDKMDDLLSPEPLDPERALSEAVLALHEQLQARVVSVNNGEKHFREGGGRIDMPDGAAIFETVGDWEDYSTPSRDLRILIAIDVVAGFPALVGRRPERFKMPAGVTKEALVAKLEGELAAQAASRKFTYERSDGSAFELSIADVLARKRELEMAYNPNDCPEVRWGAPAKSAEIATCRRRAPSDQRSKMERVRDWFRDRRRPPRGG